MRCFRRMYGSTYHARLLVCAFSTEIVRSKRTHHTLNHSERRALDHTALNWRRYRLASVWSSESQNSTVSRLSKLTLWRPLLPYGYS